MCGIAGILLREPSAIDPAFAALQAHRGPDQQGYLLDDGRHVTRHDRIEAKQQPAQLALIHHRLSIIDLTDLGQQPMSTRDGRYHLAYNGEVYNYVELRRELEAEGIEFVSRSDTEVVLEALVLWGKEALGRFEGMFALALWDAVSRRLLLARDCFGIKPLHYHLSPNRFAFASEMKAVLALDGVGRTLGANATYEYLRHSLTDDDRSTLLADVFQLEPGSWMEVHPDRPGDPVHGRYWQLERRPLEPLTFAAAAERLRDLFLRNVERHLRSDVRVGSALSGGIDSSAIVCAVRHLQPDADLHTFSYIADDETISEEGWIDIVNAQTSASVHKVRLTAKDMIDDLDDLIAAQDQPFRSTSIYAQFAVFRAAREAGIKVMLDGQGADELFGGYQYFWGARLASLVRGGQLGQALQYIRRVGGEAGVPLLLALSGPYLLPKRLQRPFRRLVGRELVPDWLNSEWFLRNGASIGSAGDSRQTVRSYSEALIRAASREVQRLLRYEDRNSMHFSIESRVPFLTSELASFAVSVPEEYSLTPDGTRKALLRAAMRGIVPDEILDRRDKIGFETPEQTWLGQLRPWVESVLDRVRGTASGPIDFGQLESEWRSVMSGKRRFDSHLWRCLNLIVWAEKNGVSLDAA